MKDWRWELCSRFLTKNGDQLNENLNRNTIFLSTCMIPLNSLPIPFEISIKGYPVKCMYIDCMTVNSVLHYTRLRTSSKLQPIKCTHVITCNETQDKTRNYKGKHLKTHFNWVFLSCYLVSVFWGRYLCLYQALDWNNHCTSPIPHLILLNSSVWLHSLR